MVLEITFSNCWILLRHNKGTASGCTGKKTRIILLRCWYLMKHPIKYNSRKMTLFLTRTQVASLCFLFWTKMYPFQMLEKSIFNPSLMQLSKMRTYYFDVRYFESWQVLPNFQQLTVSYVNEMVELEVCLHDEFLDSCTKA